MISVHLRFSVGQSTDSGLTTPIVVLLAGSLSYNPIPMDIARILNHLKDQRDALNTAISALEGTKRLIRGRREFSLNPKVAGPKRKLSPAARKRMSDAAKARWVKAKKAGRNVL
jgi:hypothetical protein